MLLPFCDTCDRPLLFVMLVRPSLTLYASMSCWHRRVPSLLQSVCTRSIATGSAAIQKPLHFVSGQRVTPLNSNSSDDFEVLEPATGKDREYDRYWQMMVEVSTGNNNGMGVTGNCETGVSIRIKIIYLVLFQTQETSAETTSGRCRRGHLDVRMYNASLISVTFHLQY